MVQLVVKTQGTSALHYLDVSDVSIKGNYSAKEIQDLKSQKSDFTQSFTLPFTKTNNDFFSHFYNVISVDGTFDSSIKCEADIYVDSNIVFSGYLQLLNVNNATQYYEALVFGVISNIATSLDEKKLNELDLSVFSHLLTAANVKDSWSGNTTYTTSASQTGEEILYPIADYGYDYNNETLNSTIEDGINATRLKPAINVKVLFEKILASIGYTINSTFFATNFFAKQYMTLANDSQTINATFQDSFRVGLSANSVNAGGVGTVTQILDLDDDTSTNPTGDFFDLTGNWDTANATPHYNVPFSGWYRFRVQVGYKFSLVFSATRGRLFIKKLNDANFSQQVFGVHNLDGDDTTLFNQLLSTDQTEDIVSDLGYYEVGDEIYFETQLTTIGTSNPPSLTIYKTQTSITLAHAPVIAEGATVNLSANNNIMPKEKQVDFISAICSRYNLIIEMDNNAANQLNIEPAQDYFDAGTSKDWSDKIDMNKDRVLKPTNEFRKAKINMSDLEDQDRLNNYWQETFGNAYNNFDTDLEGDFGEGDLEINTMFSSWNTKRPQGHNMLIAHLYKWDNGNIDFVEIKPKLFTYSGLKNCNPFKYWNTISGAFTNESQYPFCDHYLMAGNSVVGTDEDIRFKSKWAIDSQFYVDAQTTTDTYSKCWRKYLNNIYSEDSRILIANFYLTPEDISQFKYNDKIFVENSFYRINKISSYALGKNVSTKVELIKIIESNLNNKTFTVLGCDLTWFQSNINGTTVWQNSAGATVNPTQTCCEANNLTFDNNECYWNIPSTPDEPSNPPISWDATANINTTGGKVIVGETASSVVVNDSTQLYLEGTIRRLGKEASNGEILAWNSATNQTNWIANSGGSTPTLAQVTGDRMTVEGSAGTTGGTSVVGSGSVHTITEGAAWIHTQDIGDKSGNNSLNLRLYSGQGEGTDFDRSESSIPNDSTARQTGQVAVESGDLKNTGSGDSTTGEIALRSGSLLIDSGVAQSGNVIISSGSATSAGNTTSGNITISTGFSDSSSGTTTQGSLTLGQNLANTLIKGNVTQIGESTPSTGKVLQWDGSKAVWAASVGGSSTQVQYNQGGVIKGEAGFVYDEGNDRLTVPKVNTPILQSIAGDGTVSHQIYTVSQNMAILSNTSVDVYLNAGNATAGSKAFSIKSAVTGNIVFAVTDTGVIKAIGNKIQDSAGTDRIDVATAGTTKIQGNTQLLGSSPATLSGPDADKLIVSSVDDLEFKIASGGASSKSFKFINNTTEVGSINSSGDLQIDGGLTTGGGTITIGGSNSNLELDAGSDIILEADQNGGGLDSTIQYPDSGGTNRIMLGVDNNVVILSNRAANGTVQIRANSSTAGGSGETTSAIFKDDAVVLIKETEFSAGISDSGTIAAGTWNGTAIAQAKIADQAINEAKLQVSNAPVNGYVLTAQSGNTGGLTWAEQASGGGGGSSSSIITQIFTIAYHSNSTSGFYITMSGALTNESTSLSTASYHLILPCPFDGTIKRITSHHSNSVSNGTSKFEVYIDGDDDDLVGDQRGSDLTVTNGYNAGTGAKVFTADCPSDWTFSKNETLAIKRTDSSGRGGATVSFVIEFDTST